MRKRQLEQKAMDLILEVGHLRFLVNEARDMFERGDFDANEHQRDRLARFRQAAKAYRPANRPSTPLVRIEELGSNLFRLTIGGELIGEYVSRERAEQAIPQ